MVIFDDSGKKIVRLLGYEPVRQSGSYIRLTTTMGGIHHVTVPNQRPLKTGTLLGGVLKPVATDTNGTNGKHMMSEWVSEVTQENISNCSLCV